MHIPRPTLGERRRAPNAKHGVVDKTGAPCTCVAISASDLRHITDTTAPRRVLHFSRTTEHRQGYASGRCKPDRSIRRLLRATATWFACVAGCIAFSATAVWLDKEEAEPPQAAEYRESLQRQAERAEFERLAAEQDRRDQEAVIAAMQESQ